MKQLKLSLTVLITLFITSLVPMGQALATNDIPACSSGGVAASTDVCKAVDAQGTTNDPIIHIIKVAIAVISYIIGVASIVVILINVIRMITSGGNAQAAASARSGIVYALVGIAVAVLAQVIVIFVLHKY